MKMRMLAWKVWRWVMLLSALFWVQASASQSTPGESNSQISVRISTEKSRFRPGEDVPLRVEIWNEGNQDLYVCKEIEADISNALARIDLTLYYGTEAERPTSTLVVDFPLSENELPEHWIAIPPQHFYGGRVVMSASSFEKLKMPGRYRIQGKYSSRGFRVEDINDPQRRRLFLYKVWAGTVEPIQSGSRFQIAPERLIGQVPSRQ